MDRNKISHLYGHTGIRGIAATVVAPLHMNVQVFVARYEEKWIRLFDGDIAVDIFFLLSGFVLWHVYRDRIGKEVSWKGFFVARVARIIPLHYLTLVIVGAMVVAAKVLSVSAGHEYQWSQLLPQLLMVHSWPYLGTKGWIVSSWSLSAEAFAYVALFPILFFILKKHTFRYRDGILILLLVVSCSLIYPFCKAADLGLYGGWGGIARLVTCFSAGILLRGMYGSFPRLVEFSKSKLDIIALAMVVLYALRVKFQEIPPTFIYLLIPFFILGSADKGPSFCIKLLSWKPIERLGIISYSIYLLHPVLGKIVYVLEPRLGVVPPVVGILGLAVSLYLLSEMSYRYFEKPMRNYIIKMPLMASRNK